MFESRLSQGALLKKILESIRELVSEANLDCTSVGVSLQAMDSSHVSLVHLVLEAQGFEHYRCDRSVSLGINLNTMTKMLKCCGNDDSVTLKADDDGDQLTFLFESPDGDRVSEFDMKLMDIDSEHLGIPETEYKAVVKMSSGELARIMRDLATIGDTVTIDATKEGIKFTVQGDQGSGTVMVKMSSSIDKPDDSTTISLHEPVNMTFALRYLNQFTKATSLSPSVSLCMSPDVPLVVEYKIESMGHVRFYLAPKIQDDDE